jgi:hypothetical protein
MRRTGEPLLFLDRIAAPTLSHRERVAARLEEVRCRVRGTAEWRTSVAGETPRGFPSPARLAARDLSRRERLGAALHP